MRLKQHMSLATPTLVSTEFWNLRFRRPLFFLFFLAGLSIYVKHSTLGSVRFGVDSPRARAMPLQYPFDRPPGRQLSHSSGLSHFQATIGHTIPGGRPCPIPSLDSRSMASSTPRARYCFTVIDHHGRAMLSPRLAGLAADSLPRRPGDCG